MLQWVCVGVLLTLTASKMASANEECNEEDFHACKEKLLELRESYRVEEYLEGDVRIFCSAVEQNGSCWNELSIACKEKYPQFATDVATYLVNKYLFCNQDSDYVTMHKNVSDCAANYGSEFESCFPEISEDDSLDLSAMCQRSVNFLHCVADIGKRHCGEEGEIFGNAYQESVREAFASTCDVSTLLQTTIEQPTSS